MLNISRWSRDDPDGWLFRWERRKGDDGPDGLDGASGSDTLTVGAPDPEPDQSDNGDNGHDDDDRANGGQGDGGQQAPPTAPSPRRRWWAAVVVVFVVTATLTLSPVSPFEQAQDHDRVPVAPGGVEPTPHSTQEPPPKPGPTLPTLPTPTQPPPTAGPNPTRPPAPPSVPEPGPIRGDGYTLAYSDDFQGSGAPDPSVWVTAPFGGSLPPTVEDGYLTIRTTEANDYNWGYVGSTGPRSDGEPSYPNAKAWEEGYFEARIRFTDNPWSWPSFWMFSMSKSEAWPESDCSELTTEWDIFDNGIQNVDGSHPATDWYWTGLHRNTTNNTPEGYCNTPDEQRTYGENLGHANPPSWHTWSGHWTSDQLCTYFDGEQLQCTEPYDTTSQPMHLVFSMKYLPRCETCGPRPPELEMQVDWVRVWQAP